MDVMQNVTAHLDAMERLGRQIRSIKGEAKKLPDLEEEFQRQQKSLIGVLENLDVASRGNYGWEGRMTTFLLDLRRAAAPQST